MNHPLGSAGHKFIVEPIGFVCVEKNRASALFYARLVFGKKECKTARRYKR